MLDLRLPVGIFFLIIGAILAVNGLLPQIAPSGMAPAPYPHLNRDWGLCLLVFGALMAGFGAAAQRRMPPTPADEGLSEMAHRD